MINCLRKSSSFGFLFRERLSVFVCASFPFGVEGGIWDLIVLFLIIATLFISSYFSLEVLFFLSVSAAESMYLPFEW